MAARTYLGTGSKTGSKRPRERPMKGIQVPAECHRRDFNCGQQDRGVTPVVLRKMFVGESSGCVFAVGRGEWRSGAESGAGAGGELSYRDSGNATDWLSIWMAGLNVPLPKS